MTRWQAKQFYQTPAWRKASFRYRWDNPLCERCKAEGFTEAARVAHHVKPLAEGGAKFGPLEALCRRHHEEIHHRAPNAEQRAWSHYLTELRKTI